MNSRDRLLFLGAVVGALLGLAVAHTLADRVEEIHREEGSQARVRFNAVEWVKLAVAVLTVARQFANLLEPGEQA